jgi:hypothetical protein
MNTKSDEHLFRPLFNFQEQNSRARPLPWYIPLLSISSSTPYNDVKTSF